MIVGAHKGLFFAATALMCTASLYGAELSVPNINPLTRVFTGEPNRLTVPPDFPDAAPVNVEQEEGCRPHQVDVGRADAALHTASTSSSVPDCLQDAQPEQTTIRASAPQEQSAATPERVGGIVQSH